MDLFWARRGTLSVITPAYQGRPTYDASQRGVEELRRLGMLFFQVGFPDLFLGLLCSEIDGEREDDHLILLRLLHGAIVRKLLTGTG